ncbi:MAG: SAF domain-containing protein [Propionibacteriaceae bacterium]|jgi:hypothetical protein|nr:SAF domain-containing protein [Propionibacteriaceae bacterium]
MRLTNSALTPHARRSPLLIVGGIILVVVGALISVGLYTHLGRTQDVIVVTSPVARGERIERGDLATVQVGIDPALTPIPADRLPEMIGQYAQADLVPGTFLAPPAVGRQITPPRDRAEVGLYLTLGKYPNDTLIPGDTVILVDITNTDQPNSGAQGFLGSLATVTEPDSSGAITASVLVKADEAVQVAALSAADKLALVLSSRER